jgi:PAS domain S-box-containing protein
MESSNQSILVVDDTHASLHLLTEILSEEGFKVRPVSSGAFALSSALAIPPDMVLLDIRMPGMDGFEVCQQLKADARTRDIPVIFISALHEVFDKVKAFDVGGVDYITKPFQAEEVIVRIKTHLRMRDLHHDLEQKNQELSELNVQLLQEINERKRTEDALRKSEERFRLLAEKSQDLIYRIQLLPTRKFEYISPSATTITGYTPEEYYADPDLGFKVFHPDDRPILQKIAEEELSSGKPLVLRWVRKDGTILWSEQRNVPILDDTGNLIALEGIARDITEQKQAEEALRENEKRLRTLFTTMTEGVILISPDGQIVQANPAAERILGLTRSEIEARNYVASAWEILRADGTPMPPE